MKKMLKEKTEKKRLFQLKQMKFAKQNVGHCKPDKKKDRTLEKKLKTLAIKGGFFLFEFSFEKPVFSCETIQYHQRIPENCPENRD